jgi:hypothetical protein
MADQTETMTLVAKLVEDVSAKLAHINKSMIETAAVQRKAHAAATEAAKGHGVALEAVARSMRGVETAIRTAATPAFGALGISVASVGAALAGVVLAVKHYGETGRQLEMVTRRTKLHADTVRALQGVGERWGVSVEQTNEALSNFGDLLQQTRRMAPQAMQRWMQWPELYNALGRDISKLNTEQALGRVFGLLGRMTSIDQKKKALSILGLPENWAYFTKVELDKALAEEKRWAALHPFSAEKAKKADEAFRRMERSFQGLRDDLGIAFAGPITEQVERLDRWLENPENINKIKAGFGEIGRAIDQDTKDVAHLMALLEELNAWYEKHVPKTPEETKKAIQEGIDPSKFRPLPFGIPDWLKNLFDTSKNPRYGLAAGKASITETKRQVEEPVKKGVFEGVVEALQTLLAPKDAKTGAGGAGAGAGAGAGDGGGGTRRGVPGTPGGPAAPEGDDTAARAVDRLGPPTGGGGGMNADTQRNLANQTAEEAGVRPAFPVASGVNWKNMDAEYIRRANEAWQMATPEERAGGALHSGYRPPTKAMARKMGMPETSSQESIYYDQGIRPAAKPFHSMHGFGGAGDWSGRNLQFLRKYGPGVGLRELPGDEGHFQLSTPRNRKRATPSAGTPRTEGSVAGAVAAPKDANASVKVEFGNLYGGGTKGTFEGWKELNINRGYALPNASETH